MCQLEIAKNKLYQANDIFDCIIMHKNEQYAPAMQHDLAGQQVLRQRGQKIGQSVYNKYSKNCVFYNWLNYMWIYCTFFWF